SLRPLERRLDRAGLIIRTELARPPRFIHGVVAGHRTTRDGRQGAQDGHDPAQQGIAAAIHDRTLSSGDLSPSPEHGMSAIPCTPHRAHPLTVLASCGDIISYALVTVPVGICSGTKDTVESGKAGPPPHSRRNTGITCSANKCICSSTSSVLYPPP